MTLDRGREVAASPVEELLFLARSRHRIELLAELSVEERTRRDLRDASGISQPTLGRILRDFEDRRWISNHHNGAYSLTPPGALLADSVGELLEVFETVTRLAAVADYLPWDRLDFDPSHLTAATITTPSAEDPLAHMRRFDELAATASTVEVFSNVVSCAPANEAAAADREFLGHVDELVVTSDALATDLDDVELREWIRERIEEGDLALYRYDEPAALLLGTFDDTAGLVPVDDAGMPRGLIEAETDPIRTWVEETFEAYRRAGTRLTAGGLPDGAAEP